MLQEFGTSRVWNVRRLCGDKIVEILLYPTVNMHREVDVFHGSV